MHDSLTKHAAQLARLAMMIRIGLESAESAIPGINDLLAELATLGVTDFQVEGPAIYCRPAGPSSAYDDSFVVYQAAIIQPGGIGAVRAAGGRTRRPSSITRRAGGPDRAGGARVGRSPASARKS